MEIVQHIIGNLGPLLLYMLTIFLPHILSTSITVAATNKDVCVRDIASDGQTKGIKDCHFKNHVTQDEIVNNAHMCNWYKKLVKCLNDVKQTCKHRDIQDEINNVLSPYRKDTKSSCKQAGLLPPSDDVASDCDMSQYISTVYEECHYNVTDSNTRSLQQKSKEPENKDDDDLFRRAFCKSYQDTVYCMFVRLLKNCGEEKGENTLTALLSNIDFKETGERCGNKVEGVIRKTKERYRRGGVNSAPRCLCFLNNTIVAIFIVIITLLHLDFH